MQIMKKLILPAAAFALFALSAPAVNWTQFRGPNGGSISTEQNLPVQLGEANIQWKASLPGRGLSSPIIHGDRVFVTASSGPDQTRLHVICFGAQDGRRIWEREFRATGRTMTHNKTSVAAPTPVTDGRRVYAIWSCNDVVCLDLDGNLVWLRGLTLDYPNVSNSLGMSSSPIVVDGTLVAQVENDSESLAIGLDAGTGVNLWKLDRPKGANWTSPGAMRVAGRDVVLLQSKEGVHAVDPKTGNGLWYYGDGASTIPSATVAANGVLFIPSHGITAIKPGTDSKDPVQLWRNGQLSPGTASPVVLGDRVFTVNGAGILSCGDAATGTRLWQLRLQGPFSATPVVAGGHFYCVNEKGLLQVVDVAKGGGEIVGKLDLKETVLSTPSIANGALYLRSDATLWKIGR